MMMKVKKKSGKLVKAFQLGRGEKLEKQLIQQGKIKRAGDVYEIFSRECVKEHRGEKATSGDYVKFDEDGYPYPNKYDFFEMNHRYIGGTVYEQTSLPLWAWKFADGELLSEEVIFLIEKKGLVINKSNCKRYMQAPLWGTVLTADKEAVIIFYKIDRNTEGKILDEEFNFCAWEEFQKTYDVLE